MKPSVSIFDHTALEEMPSIKALKGDGKVGKKIGQSQGAQRKKGS